LPGGQGHGRWRLGLRGVWRARRSRARSDGVGPCALRDRCRGRHARLSTARRGEHQNTRHTPDLATPPHLPRTFRRAVNVMISDRMVIVRPHALLVPARSIRELPGSRPSSERCPLRCAVWTRGAAPSRGLGAEIRRRGSQHR
jgi:hypothetical protein